MKLEDKIKYVEDLIDRGEAESRSLGKQMEIIRHATTHLHKELRKMIEEQDSIKQALEGAQIGGSLPVVEDKDNADYHLMVERGGSIEINPMRKHETPKMEGEYTTRKTFGKSPLDVIAEERIPKTPEEWGKERAKQMPSK